MISVREHSVNAVTALNGAYRQLGGTTQELASKMEHNLRQAAISTDYQNRLAWFWDFGDSWAQSLQHPNSTMSLLCEVRGACAPGRGRRKDGPGKNRRTHLSGDQEYVWERELYAAFSRSVVGSFGREAAANSTPRCGEGRVKTPAFHSLYRHV